MPSIKGLNTKMSIHSLTGLFAVACVVSLSAPADAQRQPAKRATATDMSLTTRDNVQIGITYYNSTLGKNAPVVIMLHMKGSNRLVWKTNGLAKRLQGFGYAVITVDLRKHGESKVGGRKGADLRKRDYQRMVSYDLVAVKKFILKEHHAKNLNILKTAIIATEMSAPVAVVFALRDWLKEPHLDSPVIAARTPRGQDIRAIVLLSPSQSVLGVNAGKAYFLLGKPLFDVSVLVGYGKGDIVDRGGKTAQSIFNRMSSSPGAKKRMYLRIYPTKLRGTDMLGRRLEVENNIINFLNKHLKKLPGEWRDRHSRLDN